MHATHSTPSRRRRAPRLLAALAALVLLLACACDDSDSSDSDSSTDTPSGDTGGDDDTALADTDGDTAAPDTPSDDTSSPDTADDDTSPAPCAPATPAACLYVGADPDATFEVTTDDSLVDPDRVGQPGRAIPLAFYEPLDVPPPWPVVVLSHGGAEGKNSPLASMEHWAPRLARAGYLAVAIAHVPRDADERLALCTDLGATEAQCMTLKYLNYDRPHDLRLVLDHLEATNASGPRAGKLDLTRLAYMGHSAGAGATQVVAGAGRILVDEPLFFADPRPVAFVSMSPQGIGDDGFYAESWQDITRPVLVGTGLGDGGSPEVSQPRRDPFLHSAAGDKHLVWIEHQSAQHTVFEGSREACLRTADDATCDRMQQVLTATVLAFLDTYLRGDAQAAAWLASEDLVTGASPLAIEWLHR